RGGQRRGGRPGPGRGRALRRPRSGPRGPRGLRGGGDRAPRRRRTGSADGPGGPRPGVRGVPPHPPSPAVRSDVPRGDGVMLLSLFLACTVSLAGATLLLLVLGPRAPFAARLVGVLVGAAVAVGGGQLAAAVWRLPTAPVRGGEVLVVVVSVVVGAAR